MSFCILFDPRNLKTKTLCHPNVTIVMAPGVGGGRGARGGGDGDKGPVIILLLVLSLLSDFFMRKNLSDKSLFLLF